MATKINQKGLALGQILLAVALGSLVCIAIFAYYGHTSESQSAQLVVDQIVSKTHASIQNSGRTTDFSVAGNKVTINQGTAIIQPADATACYAISQQLKNQGKVAHTCEHKGTPITYTLNNGQANAVGVINTIEIGIPENFANDTNKDVVLNGNVGINSAHFTQSTNTPATVFTSNTSSQVSILHNLDHGNSSQVISNLITPSGLTISTPVTGTATIGNNYRWTETEYHNYGGHGGEGQEYFVCSWSQPREADIGTTFNPGECNTSNLGEVYYCSVLVPQSHDEIEASVFTCLND